MNRKTYKRLMIAGLVPWNGNILKKVHRRTEEDQLLRDGWQYVNITKTLKWKGQEWKLLYKVIQDYPKKLPLFDKIANNGQYHYIEFKAVSLSDKHVELYAYGNFIKGTEKPYIMKGRQVIRLES